MSKHTEPAGLDAESNDAQLKNRRDFLKSLGKWSTIIIGGIALGGVVAPEDSAGWLNGGGGDGSTHEAAVAAGLTDLVAVAVVGQQVRRRRWWFMG